MNKKFKKEMLVRRLIVKVGTDNLCGEYFGLNQKYFDDLARQIANLNKQGIEVVIVSSGAVQAGRESMGDLGLNTTHFHKKDLAGIGARHLMKRWGDAFHIFGKEVMQIWVTYGNWRKKEEKKSIHSSILNCIKSNFVVPIVNEADVISDREIKSMEKGFSENDKLARMVAFLMKADAILFLTDEGGIYTENPKKNPKAKLYKEIDAWADPKTIGISDDVSASGTGGMVVKWKQASMCAKKGMKVAIAGNEPDVVARFVKGESVGTKIGKTTIIN